MRSLLRDYVDNEDSKSYKSRRTRKRVYDDTQFAADENEAPVNAPKWTRSGYTGSLKSLVEKHIPHRAESDDQESDHSKFHKYQETVQIETTQEEPLHMETDDGEESGESGHKKKSDRKGSSDGEEESDNEGESKEEERNIRSRSVVSTEYDSSSME